MSAPSTPCAINPDTGWPYCTECQDAPAFARCKECGTIPFHIMADMCREPLTECVGDPLLKRRDAA